jgi:hypothetical protein
MIEGQGRCGEVVFELDPEVNMHLNDKAQWALIDESIHCLADQGTPEFWATFTEAKQNDS